MGHRVAWLEVDQAVAQAADFKQKLKQGQRLLLQKQQELQESQAPVKCVPGPSWAKPFNMQHIGLEPPTCMRM